MQYCYCLKSMLRDEIVLSCGSALECKKKPKCSQLEFLHLDWNDTISKLQCMFAPNLQAFRLHSEILPVPICKLLFLCKIPNCPLMKIETYRQASGNGHETINQRATAAATACTGMHLPNLSCSLISVCWLFCGFHPAKTGLFFCVR